jgi:magnesium-transporting ATPase (P-type)
MWASILTGAFLTFGLSMFFLLSRFAGEHFRGAADEALSPYLMTGYFTFFIFTAVFNAFNARTDRINLFDSITKNNGFLRVLAVIAAVQVLLVYVGMVSEPIGEIFSCYGLNAKEWVFVLALALLIVPVDMVKKAVLRKR